MFSIPGARKLLEAAGIFFGQIDDDDGPEWNQTINLNDAFFWACSDCQYVADKELPRLAELFWRYGNAGVMYWVAVEKRNNEVPEFLDVRRQIEFVQHEEAIRQEEPSSSKRAYLKREYTIGK